MDESQVSGEALLRLLVFLDASCLPKGLLESEAAGAVFKDALLLLRTEPGDAPREESRAANASEALAGLISTGLLTAKNGTVSLPPAVQESVCRRIPTERERAWIEKALGLVFAIAPPDPDEPRNWETWKMLRPHVERVLQLAEAEKIPYPTGLLMGDRLGIFCYSQGEMQKAHDLFRRALEIDEAHFGPSHPNVAVDLNNLAATEGLAGRTEEAERLYKRMTEILCHYDGPNDVRLAVLMANLADRLEAGGNLEEAERLHRHAIALDEACCGPMHPFCARETRRLASFLARVGRREEAAGLLQKALGVDEQTCGSDHPYVAEDLRALASLRFAMGREEGLDALLRRALEIDEKWHAPGAQVIMQDLLEIAAFYTRREQRNEAAPFLQSIIDIYERYHPANLPPVVISYHQLGELHAAKKEMDVAVSLYRRALELAEQSERPHAGMSVLIRAALLKALRSQGKFQEAREIEFRAAETFLREAAAKHPDDPSVQLQYATFLKDQTENYDEAERRFRKALELAPNNPAAMSALGVFLTNIRGKDGEAQELFVKAAELAPRNALVLCNLAFLLQNIRRDFDKAERLYQMALANDPNQPFVSLNYATLKLAQGDLDAADKLLQKGWAADAGGRDRASARLLLHKAILARMQQRDARLFLGQLKTLFKLGFAQVPWTGQTILDLICQKFPPEDIALFKATIQAIGSRQAVSALEALHTWRALPEVPLDAPWDAITEV